MTGSAVDRAGLITDLWEQFSLLRDLEPRTDTNRAFRELVAACAYQPGEDASAVLADPKVRAVTERLRTLCADGEFRLERYWARRVAAASAPDDELAAFPYLDNYRRLTSLELHAVGGLGVDLEAVRRVCVLGSGPLPLSALFMARSLGATVDAVDIDAEACGLATEVTGRLVDWGEVQVHHGDARDVAAVAEADLVLLAALVGLDRQAKGEVVAAVTHRMRPGSLLVVRSAHRLRTLLYPPVDPADLVAASQGRLTPLVELHPLDDVVNSVVVAVR
ncbi:MAG: nicotianamine synthase family protein, partial [Dermatophilaceae bacterium]